MKNGLIIFSLAFEILLCLVMASCASRSEVKRFQQQMQYLTEVNAKHEQQLRKIDSLLAVQQDMLRQLNATQQNSMEQLQAEMQIIEQIFKESGYQVTSLSKTIANIRQEMNTNTKLSGDSADTAKANEPQVTVNPKQLFETAQLDFNKGKFELAKMEFEQFLSLFPSSTIADDAQYYIGECLYALGKYDDARKQYLVVKQNFPQSNLVPSAIFKAAMALIKLDDIDGAERLLREIINDYPQSQEAPLAKEKLKLLGREE